MLSEVQLSIWDLSGRQVKVIYEGRLGPGEHDMIWTPGNLPDGVYVAQLLSANRKEYRKVLLIR